MTQGQNEKPTPIVLTDELARLAREMDPEKWIKEAAAAIEQWVPSVPKAKRISIEQFGPPTGFELKIARWADIGVASYHLESERVVCYPSAHLPVEEKRRIEFQTETEFLKHVVRMLDWALKHRGV